ncbi:hypothetical protein [Pedobacter sp. SL55]|uniref:hypothetical protein n=1 Tax=Pedobacter sp. SL55 TaxID=2995161 RepID=UPI00226FEE55|nr:hypothetical protein [Pedobacter sp. SL55]WAC40559.1 hypothetical protein OVA16_18640 [Pedobacter sp. SL55]
MKKYMLTSVLFTGTVVFVYNAEGWLVGFDNSAEFSDDQHLWLIKNLPLKLGVIEPWSKKIKGTLKEVPMDLSFDVFWETYGKKINRLRTEPLYKKLDDTAKALAIMRVKPYQTYCKNNNRGIADPEKYLRNGYYDTDWSKER